MRILPAFLLLFSATASQCTVASERTAQARSNNASTVLIETASQQYADGLLDQAAATLERALHIQPNNPATLHYLGVLRLQQGQYQQAETLAARSNLRAGANHALHNRNLQLIEAARNAQQSGVLPVAAKDSGMTRETAVADMASTTTPAGQFTPALQQVAQPRQVDSIARINDGEPFEIPPGYWPPPGKCRIWFPDRPPGHQPPPAKCKKLKNRVPYGAYLIHH